MQRASDVVKKLTCNWRSSYEKNVSLSPVAISNDSRTVEEIIFTDDSGSRVETWMDLTYGENNPFGETISRPLTVGSKLTLAIYIADSTGEFDVRVKQCHATQVSDGPRSAGENKSKSASSIDRPGESSRSLQLTENGCSMRRELMDNFIKLNSTMIQRLREKQLQEQAHTADSKSLHASGIVYSNVVLFKFPEHSGLSFSCSVQLCKVKCAHTCDRRDAKNWPAEQQEEANAADEREEKQGRGETKKVHHSEAATTGQQSDMNYTSNKAHEVRPGDTSNLSLLQLLPVMTNETLYYSRSVEYEFNATNKSGDGEGDNEKHGQEEYKRRSARQLNSTSDLPSKSEANVRMERRVKVIAPNLDDEPDVIEALFEKYFTTSSSAAAGETSNNSNVLHLIVCFPFPWLLLAMVIFSLSLIITIYICARHTLNTYEVYPAAKRSESLCPIAFTKCKARQSYNQDAYI